MPSPFALAKGTDIKKKDASTKIAGVSIRQKGDCAMSVADLN